MPAVVFQTPGPLDLRAITCLGVNTKPNSTNPIGFFGTGLKFAVAILCREEIPLSVVTDGEVYGFYRKTERFRDKDFDFIRMKRESLQKGLRSRAQYSELSYTTQLGKTWQLWQVFRELYSNTLDEGGTAYEVESVEDIDFQPDQTYIIAVGDVMVAELRDKDRNFLPDGLRVKQQDTRLQVLDRPSNHIYYRGMRVYDLDKPAKFTYNFLDGVELTEDRTVKNSFMIKHYIERYMMEDADAVTVVRALEQAEPTFESELTYQYHSTPASQQFMQAAATSQHASAAQYARQRAPKRSVPHPLRAHPRPWRVQGRWIVDANGEEVLHHGDGDLSEDELNYVLALLQKDLGESEMEDFLAGEHVVQLGEHVDASYSDDVPF